MRGEINLLCKRINILEVGKGKIQDWMGDILSVVIQGKLFERKHGLRASISKT